ncbi:MAG: fructosamine kinase family protein [Arachnia sp.]
MARAPGPGGPASFHKRGSRAAIATELASLAWLDVAGGAPVAAVLGSGAAWLETRFMASGVPGREAAAEFGRGLAVTHRSGAQRWGQAPPGLDPADLRLAELPAPADAGGPEPCWPSFGQFYAEARLRPYLDASAAFDVEARRLLHRACDRIASGAFDAAQPEGCGDIARIHGDLWHGNVVWAAAGDGVAGTLIDPCAHGGHAETDLAELGVFGAPHLDAILGGYQELGPLAEGWPDRVGLHQFHMVLVHVRLFGAPYLAQAIQTANSLLS